MTLFSENRFHIGVKLFGLLCLFSFVGCATLSKEQCQSGDFYGIGVRDGQYGKTQDYLNSNRASCAEHGITFDDAAYLKGREQGLREYCTAENGYHQGEQGNKYQYVCPPDLESAFLRTYKPAYLDHILAKSTEEHFDIKAKLRNEELKTEDREYYRKELYKLEAKIDDLRSQRRSLSGYNSNYYTPRKQYYGDGYDSKTNCENYENRDSYNCRGY